MKYFTYILYLAILFAVPVKGQDSLTYQLTATLKVKASLMATDVLQNIYIVDEKGVLTKYDPKGNELYKFNEFTLGNPTQVDATNPFKVLLYYPEFQTIVTLDNTLSKTGSFDLYDLGLDIIETICFSNDGNIWLYDPLAFKVKKIDHNANVLLSSDDLSLLLGKAIDPVTLLERENWLFVNDPEAGIYLFDVYGEYSKTFELTGISNFQVSGNRLVYFKDQQLFAINLKSLGRYLIRIPVTDKKIRAIRIEKKKLYMALDDEVRIYSF